MCVQVLDVDPKGLKHSQFVLNVAKPCLHHLSTGLNLLLHVIYEVCSCVNGCGNFGVATLNLGPDRAKSLLVLSSGLGNVGRNGLQGIITVVDGVSQLGVTISNSIR